MIMRLDKSAFPTCRLQRLLHFPFHLLQQLHLDLKSVGIWLGVVQIRQLDISLSIVGVLKVTRRRPSLGLLYGTMSLNSSSTLEIAVQ
jgi:hypothetical protein